MNKDIQNIEIIHLNNYNSYLPDWSTLGQYGLRHHVFRTGGILPFYDRRHEDLVPSSPSISLFFFQTVVYIIGVFLTHEQTISPHRAVLPLTCLSKRE